MALVAGYRYWHRCRLRLEAPQLRLARRIFWQVVGSSFPFVGPFLSVWVCLVFCVCLGGFGSEGIDFVALKRQESEIATGFIAGRRVLFDCLCC